MAEIVWEIKNPLTLHMLFRMRLDGMIVAEFPALPDCMSQGRTLDEALLNLAIAIQSKLRNGSAAA